MPKYWYDHTHLVSPDPAKTAQLYQSLFGAKLVDTRQLPDGRTVCVLDLNGTDILVTNPRSKPQEGSPLGSGYGLDHFGIRTDNLEAAAEELKAQGVKFTEEIKEGRPGTKLSFLLGPENVLIELLERSK